MSARSFVRYLALGCANAAAVYAVYTPYVFLWVRLDWVQYVRWLEGGVVYALLTGWAFSLLAIRLGRWLQRRGL